MITRSFSSLRKERRLVVMSEDDDLCALSLTERLVEAMRAASKALSNDVSIKKSFPLSLSLPPFADEWKLCGECFCIRN
jgi:hypothetical protein